MIDIYTAMYGEKISMAMLRDSFQMVHATIQQKWLHSKISVT